MSRAVCASVQYWQQLMIDRWCRDAASMYKSSRTCMFAMCRAISHTHLTRLVASHCDVQTSRVDCIVCQYIIGDKAVPPALCASISSRVFQRNFIFGLKCLDICASAVTDTNNNIFLTAQTFSCETLIKCGTESRTNLWVYPRSGIVSN